MSTLHRRALAGFASLSCLSVLALLVSAGPLNPPAGAVTGTAKPLSEVEPRVAVSAANTPGDADSLFKITQPGSYYLTGNITGVAFKNGIEIASSGVTLDLNGFDVVGIASSGSGVSDTAANLTNITVVNGSVRNWGFHGVHFWSASVSNVHLEGVHASGNAYYGIAVGANSTITKCSVSNNGAGVSNGSGITTRAGCTVSNCAASNNTGNGITTEGACVISNCTAIQNTRAGFYTDFTTSMTNCSAYGNTNEGIFTSVGSTITNCTAVSNGAAGIMAVEGCTIAACTARTNGSSGISAGSGGTVTNCTARANTQDGIMCDTACVILANTCDSNGNTGDGAGIHATGTNNRIEGNNCARADRGIDVDGIGNIIIRNTCTGNTTNWDIIFSNLYGPILDRTLSPSPGVTGNSAISTLDTTDPHANFSY